jgi:hypothetical protein
VVEGDRHAGESHSPTDWKRRVRGQGDRGTPELGIRIEWVGAGNGYRVGTGTWKVVRGTGEYAELAGGGRRGDMWLDRGRGALERARLEGFLTSPGT